MKLLDIFKAVKEENLQKHQLEQYHQLLSQCYSDMQLELGSVKKQKALWMGMQEEAPMTKLKAKWELTPEGQREIELKAYIRATSPLLNSLKSRLYILY